MHLHSFFISIDPKNNKINNIDFIHEQKNNRPQKQLHITGDIEGAGYYPNRLIAFITWGYKKYSDTQLPVIINSSLLELTNYPLKSKQN